MIRRQHPGRPLVIAHRGYSALYPDNTLLSFEKAIEAGADIIETDVRKSADGILVCSHEPKIGGRDVSAMTAQELRAQGILETESLFLRGLHDRAPFLFDIKTNGTCPDVPDTIARLCHLVALYGAEKQAVLGVRSTEHLQVVRQHDKDVAVLGFLPDARAFGEFYAHGGNIGRLWECNGGSVDLTAENLALCGAQGRHPVWITAQRGPDLDLPGYTDQGRLAALAHAGIDGVLVNDPKLAREFFTPRPHPVRKSTLNNSK
jgi:glycerophosphoryl diester phosphodiesterase